MKMETAVCLDSGAFTLYHQTRKHGKKLTEEKFDAYLDDYVSFCKKNKNNLDFFVTLDKLFNPVGSYEVYKRMLKMGVNPIPVIHYGTNIKWLKKYIEHTDFVCLGGRSRPATFSEYIGWAAQMFRCLAPAKVKVHGLAVTSPRLLKHFPWYSVDSATAFHHSTCGLVHLPRLDMGGKESFLVPLSRVIFSDRDRTSGGSHFHRLPRQYQHDIRAYLEKLHVTVEDLNTYHGRNIANLHYFTKMAEAIEERRGEKLLLYTSGQPSGGKATQEDWVKLFADLNRAGVKSFPYMGSFFRKKHTVEYISATKEWQNGSNTKQRTTSKLPQASKPRSRLSLSS